MSSDKSFSLAFSTLFFILAVAPLLKQKHPNVHFLGLSVIFVLISLFSPALLYWPNFVWFRLGEGLRKLTSPFVLALVFFVVITPLSLFLRLMKKDLLNLSFSKEPSYWTKLRKTDFTMRDQF